MTDQGCSLEEYEVMEIIREAASVAASEVRCMGYRPANEVNISFRMPTNSGRARYRNGKIKTYREGLAIARTLFNQLCASEDIFDDLSESSQEAALNGMFARRCGLVDGRVVSKPIKGGFMLTLQLAYAGEHRLAQSA
jgi:hypothetical protein